MSHRPRRRDFPPRNEDAVRPFNRNHSVEPPSSITFNEYNVTVNNTTVQQPHPHPGVFIANRHLRREAKFLREENEEKERQLDECIDEINQYEKENEDLKRRIDQTKNAKTEEEERFIRQVKQNKDMIQGLSKENINLQTENKSVKSEFSTVERANGYLKEELTVKEKQLEQEKREKELSTMTATRLKEMIMAYETEAVSFKKRVEYEIMRRDQEIAEKKSEIRYLKKDIEKLNELLETIQNRTEDEWRLEVERLQVKLMEEIKNGRQASEEVIVLKDLIERLKAEKNASEVKKVEEGKVPISKICSDLKIENGNLKNQNLIYLSVLIILGSIMSAWLLLKLV